MNILMLLEMAGSAAADRLVLGSARDGLTADELYRRASSAATTFRAAGAGSVAYLGMHGVDSAVALFGAAAAGIPFVPLNYRLADDRIDALVRRLEAPFLLVDDTKASWLDGRLGATLGEWSQVCARPEGPTGGDGGATPATVDEDDVAVMLFTSGTTAEPKAAILRHRHLVSYVLQTVDLLSADEDDALLVSVPPYHVAGVSTVLTNVFAGRRLVFLGDFVAREWLRTVATERITHAMLVPTMLARILDELDELGVAAPESSTLRAIAYGGARMPPTVLRRSIAAFGDVSFTNAYGLTETSSTVAVLGPDDHRAALAATDPDVQARLASVGRLVPGVEGIVRADDGTPLPVGDVGEVWLRGPQVAGEYRGAGSSLDADGWFPTKDRGRFDSGGFLFLEGRNDEVIIKGGENISPAEIEDVLAAHPGVKDVAVVGLPDDEWGARIAAVVVASTASPPAVDDLRSWVRSRLRGSRTPDVVVFRVELPQTPTGKVLRRVLVAELAGLDDGGGGPVLSGGPRS